MVSDVLPINPSFTIPLEIGDDVIITPISGGLERRKLLSSLQLRAWQSVNIEAMTLHDHKLLTDFQKARSGRYEPFSFLPPVNYGRLTEGLVVGTGDGMTTEFDLDNTDFYRRVYLGTGNRNKAFVSDVEMPATFTNDDTLKTSKVTFQAAPGVGWEITVNIDAYAICRFDSTLKANQLSYNVFSASFSLRELARDSI